MVLPDDGWLPLAAAAGTAGFFLLLTVGWVVTAWACGPGALACIWAWLWGLDRAPPIDRARSGRDCSVAVGGDGGIGHAKVALWLLLAADATVFLSLLYAHLRVAMAAAVCPPPGAALPASGLQAAAALLWTLALVVLVVLAVTSRRVQQGGTRAALQRALLLAIGISMTAFGADLLGHTVTGLAPRRDAWSATVAALLAMQGLHVVAMVLFGAFATAGAGAGLLLSQRKRSANPTLAPVMTAC